MMNNFMQNARVNSSNLIYSETIASSEIVCAYCGETKVYNSGELIYKYKKIHGSKEYTFCRWDCKAKFIREEKEKELEKKELNKKQKTKNDLITATIKAKDTVYDINKEISTCRKKLMFNNNSHLLTTKAFNKIVESLQVAIKRLETLDREVNKTLKKIKELEV